MEETKETLNRNIELSINGNTYNVCFPTVNQFIAIEAKKSALSHNQYGAMILNRTKVASKALDFIDMLSYFSVLIPDLMKDSKVPLTELDIMDGKELLKVYMSDFKVWMDKWMVIINKDETSEEV